MQFLSKYGRWNSPKYLFGESYGTPRSANLINVLETEDDTDFNGVILLSQILNFDDSPDIAAAPTRASIWPISWRCRPTPQPPGTTTRWPTATSRCSSCSVRSSSSQWAITPRRYARADPELRPVRCDRRQAARLHGPAGELHQAGQPAHHRRRVRAEPAGRRRPHHGAARLAVLRSVTGSAERGRGI